MRLFLTLLLFLTFAASSDAQRYSRTINENWLFTGGESGRSETVSIPHTWNAEDATDEAANEEALREALCDYCKKACEAFAGYSGSWGITPDDFNIVTHYIHGAYNNAVDEVRDVMYYLARREAIIIDPCYTGKTFEAVVDGAKNGSIEKGSDVIFMHTGGLPGIYTKHHRVELERELMPYMHTNEF